MSQKFKKRIFEILETATPGDRLSRIFDIFIVTLICINIMAVILETVKSLYSKYMLIFRNFEIFSKGKKEELIIAIVMILILLIISSSLMYFVESGAQPQTFTSIPAAMWWGVTTLTTVGYGDVYPVTPLGKLLGAII